MSDVDILIAIALATEGAAEQPAGSNRGAYVDRLLKQLDIPLGSSWCAAAVYDWGKKWEKATGKKWPLPATAGCAVLAEFAKKNGILMDTPEVGDVFVIWEKSLGRFGHTGVVTSLPNGSVSGNTTKPGQAPGAPTDPREGWVVAVKPWRTGFAPEDKFIRWSKLIKP